MTKGDASGPGAPQRGGGAGISDDVRDYVMGASEG